ncbi:hypothetical protein M5K25_009262 [Dendrobium thyrsiflorum]|uniref:Uncharacterized protein n=1 Tax=Dendrobium thyrsiflorum TaxID=117978 RepID=A0ABD0V5D4_DENTH
MAVLSALIELDCIKVHRNLLLWRDGINLIDINLGIIDNYGSQNESRPLYLLELTGPVWTGWTGPVDLSNIFPIKMVSERCLGTIDGCNSEISADIHHPEDLFISTNNKRMEEKFAVMEEMLKKLLEVKTAPAISEARETIGGHGRRGNSNMFRGRENPEVEILEGEDGMPLREEKRTGFEGRVDF